MALLALKITGVRGGNPSWKDSTGEVVAFVDNSKDYISVDAFEGSGHTYKRREKSEVEIMFNGSIWRGTLEELAEKLNLK